MWTLAKGRGLGVQLGMLPRLSTLALDVTTTKRVTRPLEELNKISQPIRF